MLREELFAPQKKAGKMMYISIFCPPKVTKFSSKNFNVFTPKTNNMLKFESFEPSNLLFFFLEKILKHSIFVSKLSTKEMFLRILFFFEPTRLKIVHDCPKGMARETDIASFLEFLPTICRLDVFIVFEGKFTISV